MTVVDVTQDPERLTMSITTDLAAPPERVWQVWSDPRQLERWWGPPTWPATFVRHEMEPGGGSSYLMTGPEGDTSHGWFRFLTVEPPTFLELEDGFADADGNPDDSMPTARFTVEIVATEEGARMTVTTHFGSVEQMQQLIDMGMRDGMTLAMGQIDGILAAS